MKRIFSAVEPIRPGYDWQTRIDFSAEFWASQAMDGFRLVAHFRSSLPGSLLAVADTADNSIQREDPSTILIRLRAVETVRLGGSSIVVFDLVSIDESGAGRPVAGRWTWPISLTVTRNVDGEEPEEGGAFLAASGRVHAATFDLEQPPGSVEWMPVVSPGGAPGRSVHIIGSDAELTAAFGVDGDHAILRTDGAEWKKEGGAWVETGENFLGTLLPGAIAARNAAGEFARLAGVAAEGAALDRLAVEDDRRQTGEDREAVSGYRQATGEDRIATADDRRQTGEDRIAANVAKINWRGAYAPGTAYSARDAVSHAGSSWIAKTATTGNAPPSLPQEANDWWELMTARGRAYETFGVSIFKAGGIDLGGYYAELSANALSLQSRLYAEIVDGSVGSVVEFTVDINGVPATGPLTVTRGAPLLQTISLPVGEGARLSFTLIGKTGTVTEFFAKTYGAIS